MTTRELLFAGHCYFSAARPVGQTFNYRICYNAHSCNYDIFVRVKFNAFSNRRIWACIGSTDTLRIILNDFGTCIDEDMTQTLADVLDGKIEPTFSNRCVVCGAILGLHAHDHISPQCKKKLETWRYNIVNKIV